MMIAWFRFIIMPRP